MLVDSDVGIIDQGPDLGARLHGVWLGTHYILPIDSLSFS